MEKNSQKLLNYGTIVLIIGAIVVLFAPYILTRNWFGISFLETGQIGDTIGGITAPFVNLISAILVYLALYAQVEANKLVQKQIDEQKQGEIEQKNFANLLEIYKQIKADFDDFEIKIFEKNSSYDYVPVISKGRKALDLFYDEIHNYERDRYTPVRLLDDMESSNWEHQTEYNLLLHTFKVFAFLTERLASEKLADSDKSTLIELSKYLFLSRFEGLIPNEFKLPKELFNSAKEISDGLNLQTTVSELVQVPGEDTPF